MESMIYRMTMKFDSIYFRVLINLKNQMLIFKKKSEFYSIILQNRIISAFIKILLCYKTLEEFPFGISILRPVGPSVMINIIWFLEDQLSSSVLILLLRVSMKDN